MRHRYPGYFRPRNSDFDKIWKKGLIVPDTNIFLHLLRYRRETRDEIIKTLRALKTQLWVPSQVAFEFSKRWMDVEAGNRASYEKLKSDIQQQGRSLAGLYDSVARYQVVDATLEKEKIDAFVKSLCASIEGAAKHHPSFDEAEKNVDEITSLIGDEIAARPSPDVLKQWASEASERYAKQIPPGYKDEGKDGADKYGDYIIWREMMDVAREKKRPVLFLSDDRKEDWALLRGGQDKGPRPEIIQEFWESTQQLFYSYPLRAFLERAKQYTKVEVSQKAIEEVEEQSRRRNEELRREETQIRRADYYLRQRSVLPVERSAVEHNLEELRKRLASLESKKNPILLPQIAALREGLDEIEGRFEFSRARLLRSQQMRNLVAHGKASAKLPREIFQKDLTHEIERERFQLMRLLVESEKIEANINRLEEEQPEADFRLDLDLVNEDELTEDLVQPYSGEQNE